MDDLIAQIQEKTGLPADKVLEVVTMVTDFLKQTLPADLVNQITEYLSKSASTAGGTASSVSGSAASSATKAAGAVAGAAGAAVSKSLGAMSDLLARSEQANDDGNSEAE